MTKLRSGTRKKAAGSGRFWSKPQFWFGVFIAFFAAVIGVWAIYFEKQARQVDKRRRSHHGTRHGQNCLLLLPFLIQWSWFGRPMRLRFDVRMSCSTLRATADVKNKAIAHLNSAL